MKSLRIAGRAIAALAGLCMIAACLYLLVKGKAESAMPSAIVAGIIGYVLLRPGKRTAKFTLPGGVVMDIISDDTAAFKTGIDAAGKVASSVSQEISERTRTIAIQSSRGQ